jgi:hypothetical protein
MIEKSNHRVEIQDASRIIENDIVFIETNRWRPDKCMWIVKKSRVERSNVHVIFPFPELWASICHIFIGTSENHSCFIHLTPLTSLFRTETGELEKIHENLRMLTGNNKNWQFSVYYFDDQGREDKFRSVVAKVLGGNNVNFSSLLLHHYPGGNFYLVYNNLGFSFSTADFTKMPSPYKDASNKGSFNKIPIYAIE